MNEHQEGLSTAAKALWFVALWAAGVITISVIGFAIKFILAG